jgi:hypothetical protein
MENTQQQNAIQRTEILLAELKDATNFTEVKAALVDYVEDLDCCNPEDDAPFIFGDMDFAQFFIRSLELRGKEPLQKSVPLMAGLAIYERKMKTEATV